MQPTQDILNRCNGNTKLVSLVLNGANPDNDLVGQCHHIATQMISNQSLQSVGEIRKTVIRLLSVCFPGYLIIEYLLKFLVQSVSVTHQTMLFIIASEFVSIVHNFRYLGWNPLAKISSMWRLSLFGSCQSCHCNNNKFSFTTYLH